MCRRGSGTGQECLTLANWCGGEDKQFRRSGSKCWQHTVLSLLESSTCDTHYWGRWSLENEGSVAGGKEVRHEAETRCLLCLQNPAQAASFESDICICCNGLADETTCIHQLKHTCSSWHNATTLHPCFILQPPAC
jgi:hypothetical protein